MAQGRTLLLLGSAVTLLLAGACANRPPTLNCVASQTTVTEGNSVRIDSNASDPDKNDQLTFSWSASSGKITSQNGSAEFDSAGLTPGTYTVDLQIQDPKRNHASCSVDLVVEKNKQPPTIACEPASLSVTEGRSKNLSVRASDPNQDALNYGWKVDAQSITNNSSSFNFGTSGRSIGTHRVNVTVTDVDGLSANCNFSITIDRRPNNDPTVSISLDKTEVYAGQTVTAKAQASDPDGDPLTYSWKLDSRSQQETSAQLSINTSGLSGGTHSALVSVSDDRQGNATAAQSFSVREKIVVQISGVRLDNIGKAQLDEVALKLQQNPQLRALAIGHTDNVGSAGGNERMGQKRADAVKKYLVKTHSVNDGRIETKSSGETQPVADNSTPQGREENRRVEVELFVR